jgi:hypothetical protein
MYTHTHACTHTRACTHTSCMLTQGEDCHLQAKERGCRRNQPCWYMCNDLNVNCLPQAHAWNAWSPAGRVILGSSGNIGRLAYLEEVGHWRHGFESYTWSPVPSSLSLLPVHHKVRKLLCHMLLRDALSSMTLCPPWWCSAQAHRAKQPGTEPSETMNQSKVLPPLSCSFGYFGHSYEEVTNTPLSQTSASRRVRK